MVNFTAIENFKMKKLIQFICLLFVFAACEDSLDTPSQSFLNATLRYTDDDKDESIDSIEVEIAGLNMTQVWLHDTLFITDNDTVRTALLPLEDSDTTSYVFVLNGMTDTVSIVSESNLVYESMESGFYSEYKILNVLYTTHRIDYIEVADSSVTKEWNENIIVNINTDIVADN